ncbi:hypothetical protein L2E82_29563 [Cichorium intybus]|uniref:Uncharacterized protein n=1 Tax=Cichorium intybus TaxID=13427 RepID=A0ACB9CYA5_CICIN|nr:hypothetical protein L2E82_29563 [Cichorium intybus]
MRGILDRYNRATEPSTSQLQIEMRQEQVELEVLRNEITRLRNENARLMGNNLGGMGVQELIQLEHQLSNGIISVRDKKNAMVFEEMEHLKHRERELGYENEVLRGEIDKLRRYIPLALPPAQPPFLEQTQAAAPSSSAGLSKHDRVSPDTVCYYGSDNTDSETALQLRPPCSDHSKTKESTFTKRESNSSSCRSDDMEQ